MLFRSGDIERLLALISDPDRPIQIIFAGKAHPADEPGKTLIRKIANLRHDSRTSGRLVFVEDYDINVCRHLIQGVDVWLNNPRRPLEASGTSGQKVVLNGGLNCSILDGWWAEAFDGRNGFAIGRGETHANDEITDRRDGEALYKVLEQEVIPLFYDRDSDGPVACAAFRLENRHWEATNQVESVKIRQACVTLAEALLA